MFVEKSCYKGLLYIQLFKGSRDQLSPLPSSLPKLPPPKKKRQGKRAIHLITTIIFQTLLQNPTRSSHTQSNPALSPSPPYSLRAEYPPQGTHTPLHTL